MAKSSENPLLPHARIRELFRAMLHAASCDADPRTAHTVIAVASPLRDLEPRALCAPDPMLHPILKLALGLKQRQVSTGTPSFLLQQELTGRPVEQLYVALGASAASRVPALLVPGADTLDARQWTRLLTDAARLQAPIVLLALPGNQPALAALADRAGVPGIAVDTADPIALYRVAAECFGRARAGGGPALIEAVRLSGKTDALALLRRQVVAHHVATERWVMEQEQRGPLQAAP